MLVSVGWVGMRDLPPRVRRTVQAPPCLPGGLSEIIALGLETQ